MKSDTEWTASSQNILCISCRPLVYGKPALRDEAVRVSEEPGGAIDGKGTDTDAGLEDIVSY